MNELQRFNDGLGWLKLYAWPCVRFMQLMLYEFQNDWDRFVKICMDVMFELQNDRGRFVKILCMDVCDLRMSCKLVKSFYLVSTSMTYF